MLILNIGFDIWKFLFTWLEVMSLTTFLQKDFFHLCQNKSSEIIVDNAMYVHIHTVEQCCLEISKS